MEKGCGWLLKTSQEKDKAGISPWECLLGPCLKPQDHTCLKIFLFLLAFQGTRCCLFASVQLPNCDGSLLETSSKQKRNQLRALVLLEITG